MKIKFVLFFFAIFLLAAACGDDGDGDDSNAGKPNPGAPTVVVYPEEVVQGVDTMVTITATSGYAVVGSTQSGTNCLTSGFLQGNPATIMVLGSSMSVGNRCVFTIKYEKDGYQFTMPVSVGVISA